MSSANQKYFNNQINMENQILDPKVQKEIILKYKERIRQIMNSNVPNVPEFKQSECKLQIVESIISTLFKEVTELITMRDPLKTEIAEKVNELINLHSEHVSNEEAVLYKVALLLSKGKAAKIENALHNEFPVLETTDHE